MSDEWPETGEGVSIGECDHCGVVRPVRVLSDPFVSEVYGEQSRRSHWCLTDYQNRKDDV